MQVSIYVNYQIKKPTLHLHIVGHMLFKDDEKCRWCDSIRGTSV